MKRDKALQEKIDKVFTPARGWGLKQQVKKPLDLRTRVHPRTGVGIETMILESNLSCARSSPPHGGGD